MDEGMDLSPAKLQFIEDVGLYFQQYGLALIGGRVLGLLMLAERPLTLDAMATTLGVARSSISTNIRVSVRGGMVDRASFPGDRRDYYRFASNTWDSATRVGIESLLRLRRIADRGLTAMAPVDQLARDRLTELADFCEFMTAEQQASLERWRERRGTAAQTAISALDGYGRRP